MPETPARLHSCASLPLVCLPIEIVGALLSCCSTASRGPAAAGPAWTATSSKAAGAASAESRSPTGVCVVEFQVPFSSWCAKACFEWAPYIPAPMFTPTPTSRPQRLLQVLQEWHGQVHQRRAVRAVLPRLQARAARVLHPQHLCQAWRVTMCLPTGRLD